MKNNLLMNLYFDGASRGNPGKASYGCVVYDEEGNEMFFENKYIGNKTNAHTLKYNYFCYQNRYCNFYRYPIN